MKKKYILLLLLQVFISSFAQTSLKIRDVYDFSVGDTFQYYFEERVPGYNLVNHIERVVINKDSIGDTLVYDFKDTKWNASPYPSYNVYPTGIINFDHGYDHIIGIETYQFKIANKDSIAINLLDFYTPYADLIYYSFDTTYSVFSYDYQTDILVFKRNGMNSVDRKYAVGLGEIEYDLFIESWSIHPSKKMTYYSKKNGQSWGSKRNVGISDPNNISISIYPNPATNKVFVQSEAVLKEATITFYDMLGREIYSHSLDELDGAIDVHSWQEGIYFYNIKNKTGNLATGKIIVE